MVAEMLPGKKWHFKFSLYRTYQVARNIIMKKESRANNTDDQLKSSGKIYYFWL